MVEAVLQRLIIARVNAIPGCFCWRQNTGAFRTKNGFVHFGLVGQADISGVLRGGRRLEIECKSESGRLTDEQKEFQRKITELGGLHIVARCLEDAINPIMQVLS